MKPPPNRPLSDAEIKALPGRMADMIDLKPVRLINARHPVGWLARYILGHRHVIVVRGSNIYWPRLPEDLSAKPELIGLLAHELTHVWQYQKGMNIFKYMFRERGRYKYKLLPDQPFKKYGYEQQAAMVEDWARLNHRCMARYNHRCSVRDLSVLVPFADDTEPLMPIVVAAPAPAAPKASAKRKAPKPKTDAKTALTKTATAKTVPTKKAASKTAKPKARAKKPSASSGASNA
ncbi:hypothetical protein Q1W73_10425 [Asticcacaulis sp. ZE23SCel15]|uniref:hypothetical protein n=1 Tax=Asticcacaulis sp. ZE23SCel15 TaxID=3059027 RepID=UPI00265DF2A1|nr:hypothetical protein [Asticcacaulis sp. ZE23SCel15]WKL56114.1 hypothetical protein Q1W73_10425 [Asticcacaulis sp. ZE23SCel15]